MVCEKIIKASILIILSLVIPVELYAANSNYTETSADTSPNIKNLEKLAVKIEMHNGRIIKGKIKDIQKNIVYISVKKGEERIETEKIRKIEIEKGKGFIGNCYALDGVIGIALTVLFINKQLS